MPTITSFVNEKRWPDGGVTLSFKMDAFVRKALAEVPDGTYIQIARSNMPDKGSHFMSWKGTPNPQKDAGSVELDDSDIPF